MRSAPYLTGRRWTKAGAALHLEVEGGEAVGAEEVPKDEGTLGPIRHRDTGPPQPVPSRERRDGGMGGGGKVRDGKAQTSPRVVTTVYGNPKQTAP